MAKKSTHEILLTDALEDLKEQIPHKYHSIIIQFVACYRQALGSLFDEAIPNLLLFLQLTHMQFKSPYTFEPYHKKVRHPIDYYRFSMDFISPLIDLPHSKVFGIEHLDDAANALQQGENAILLANHQTEPDPQVISILLEKTHPDIAEKIIYVAGERVVTDPLAIPFSMGCDLLCIFSKRYIDHPQELKTKKQLHNNNTMQQMGRLLQQGGRMIYVAPSGGRDRRNEQGIVEVAPFDPASIEMFYLMAKKAKTPTRFLPFALSTFDLFPPPETVQKELGEARIAKRTPVFLSFAPPFDMESFSRSTGGNRVQKRENRAREIWAIVNRMYQKMGTP
ncbi:MAG TPA: 1-acyl-sn-glycerol-3-phosphate acyltransferase [Chlamydiales bacterium]|nr:1-acyl-sn-glycerol-3-phosphate acyltransferase [Chlamydiales bacterium]